QAHGHGQALRQMHRRLGGAHALRAGLRERRLGHVAQALVGGGAEEGRIAAGRNRCAHACVPPTVSASTLSVGCPTPTGTLWPSLPQVPTPVSSARSLPTIDTRVSTSGPLPMSVAPLTGRVTFPCSMR